jgi:hypothetical protein
VNKEKQFDCVKFKNELQEKMLKNSGAKNLREYVDYANKLAKKSSLHNFYPKNSLFPLCVLCLLRDLCVNFWGKL